VKELAKHTLRVLVMSSTEVPRQLWEETLDFKKAISVLRNQEFDVDSILNAFVKDQSALPSLQSPTVPATPTAAAVTPVKTLVHDPSGVIARNVRLNQFLAGSGDQELSTTKPLASWGVQPEDAIALLYTPGKMSRDVPWRLVVSTAATEVSANTCTGKGHEDSPDVVAMVTDGKYHILARFSSTTTRRDAIGPGVRQLRKGDLIELGMWVPVRQGLKDVESGKWSILAVKHIAILSYIKVTDVSPVKISFPLRFFSPIYGTPAVVEVAVEAAVEAAPPISPDPHATVEVAVEAAREVAAPIALAPHAPTDLAMRTVGVAVGAAAGSSGDPSGSSSDDDNEDDGDGGGRGGMDGGGGDDGDDDDDDAGDGHHVYMHDGHRVCVACGGEYCSAIGNQFFRPCVTGIVGIPELDEMASANRYATEDTMARIDAGTLEKDAPHLCRHLCYYFYARDIFNFTEREQLPACVIAMVRARWSSGDGSYSSAFHEEDFAALDQRILVDEDGQEIHVDGSEESEEEDEESLGT